MQFNQRKELKTCEIKFCMNGALVRYPGFEICTMHNVGLAAQLHKAEIDHTIDVRYEPDLMEAFNKFIQKWCGGYYPHLIDSDENDGEFIRQKIAALTTEAKHLTKEKA